VRYGLERAWASWVIGGVRSAGLGSRLQALRLPQIAALLTLLGVWGALVLTLILVDEPPSWCSVLLVVLAVLIAVLIVWRIVGEALPGMSVLGFMAVMGCSVDEVPRSPQDRMNEVLQEWVRRLGADAANCLPSTWIALRRHAIANWSGAAVGVLLMTVAVLLANANLPGGGWWYLAALAAVLLLQWFSAGPKRAWHAERAAFRTALVQVFGEPLPPGPPTDPTRFREWVSSTKNGGAAPQTLDGKQ
jgi:hypothetical protein